MRCVWAAWCAAIAAVAQGPDAVALPTLTPFATPTSTATFTATPTSTPVPTAEPGCQWSTFRLTSEDDASWARIDQSEAPAWPPAGGDGLSDVTGDASVRIMVQGSSDTLAALSVWGEIPPAIAWPARMRRLAGGAWAVDSLAVNNQSTIDLRAIRIPMAPPDYEIPWIEDWPHPPCGDSGLRSDLVACDPDVVILVPEANDAMWPHLYPEQLLPPPQALAEALIGQCDAVHADNPLRTCLVATVSKAPYVATWPATNWWIDRANEAIRGSFPATQVVDFTTGSSDALDYQHVPFGYEPRISHSNQRLHDVRAARAFAALAHSAFSTEAAVLQAEVRLWNGVPGSSLFAMRWDTSALPDDGEVREAVVELRVAFRGGVGLSPPARSLGLQWANGPAADGWQAEDWPSELDADAYPGGDEIGPEGHRDTAWSATLLSPDAVSRTGYTGLFGFVTPHAPPADDTYVTFDAVAYDAVTGPPRVCLGTARSNAGVLCPKGDECTGDALCLVEPLCIGGSNVGARCPRGGECGANGFCVAPDAAPKLHVYVCDGPPPQPSATVTALAATPTAADSATPTPVARSPTATPTAPPVVASPTTTPSVCPGDCDGDGAVTIHELIVGVSLALGRQPLLRCPPFDVSGDGSVAIEELLAALNRALDGCPVPAGTAC